MSRLTWDERNYETGLDRGVFYPKNSPGESWNGLVNVRASHAYPDGSSRYIDGVRIASNNRRGQFSGTIEAFTYPDSFFEDPLFQRLQKRFGMSYRVDNKIHLVYNVLIQSPSHTTEQLETEPFSWDFTTTPMSVPGERMSSHLIVDEQKAYAWTITQLENLLYGSDEGGARLPSPEEVLAIFDVNSILKVTDNGDGTFTIDGPDDAVIDNGDGTFSVTWPSVVIIDSNEYSISSL